MGRNWVRFVKTILGMVILILGVMKL